MSDRVRGTMKWWSEAKGYGFAATKNGDVFVHVDQLPDEVDGLQQDQNVTFEIEFNKKGLRAVNVRTSENV